MQNIPSSLSELIEQLGRTYSPFERLKILGRAWALLRKMTPEQRMTVAAQLGLEHADELVESIAARSGNHASPTLLAMIERAQTKGRAHLPELIADLRNPSRRGERLRQGAKAVLAEAETALAGETPEVPWLPPGSVAAQKAPPKPSTPPPQAVQPAGKSSAPAPAQAKPPEPPQPALPSAAAPEPTAIREQTAAPASPIPVIQLALPAEPKPAPSASASPATPPPGRATMAEPRQDPLPSIGDGTLGARLADASSLTTRFHLLRRHLEEARKLPAGGQRALLEVFPDGWARRRAVLAILRAGSPGSLRDALALVEALGSERDRLWCLGALADSRQLVEGEKEALLALASPLARRRLERRLAR